MTATHHLIMLPILLPMLAGIALLLGHKRDIQFQRSVSLAVVITLVTVAIVLIGQAMAHGHIVYEVGEWKAPYGIVLVLDRLSALMLMLVASLAFFCALYSWSGIDNEGPYFHALFQFQLMGLNGAFLTGDLFNLFVFFEISLVASYTLLLHGANRERSAAGIHYVVLNLLASVLFLFAVGTFYGMTGTLNLADLAVTLSTMDRADLPLVKTAGLLLLIVFAMKAALLPLLFWLPGAYGTANGAAAALFALMGKVGIYCILRVYYLMFGDDAGELANLAWPWLWPVGLATIAIGSFGVLAATTLRTQTAWLIVVSMGILSAALALDRIPSVAATLFYLVHTTLVTAALFMVAHLVAQQRGELSDKLMSMSTTPPRWLAFFYFIGAIAVIGLPPLSGFSAKLLLLNSAGLTIDSRWFWPIVLVSSLAVLIAMCRAGIVVFWEFSGTGERTKVKVAPAALIATLGLLLLSPLLSVFGGKLIAYTDVVAHQLHDSQAYIQAVLGAEYLQGGAR